MSSDLEGSLVDGGITPMAAKILSNAIANLASSQLSLGRQYGDATPAKQLRMVDGNTRRYVLTNLDHPPDSQFAGSLSRRGDRYKPRDTRHPYEGSQPATAQPTLTTTSVTGGDYMSADPATKDSVSQTKVGLKVSRQGGSHARLNPATGTVESVPFLVENDQEQFIDAKFEERPEGTVLKLRLRNLDKLFTVTTSHPNLIEGTVTPTNEGVALNITLKGIRGFNDFTNAPLWAWDR
jgi:hypothetical protein